MLMFLREPSDQICPEQAVTLPGQEGRWAPVGSAIRREDRTASSSNVANSDAGIISEAGNHLGVGSGRRAIVTKELRPVGKTPEDRVIGLDDGRRDSLR